MHCVRTVTENLYWVGANDHRLALFENIHPIPKGVSYNAYLLLDEKSVLFDTVDWSACRQLLENLEYLLNGTPLDYLVINHMEPDHGASIEEILLRYPKVRIISTEKAFMLMRQFGFHVDGHECIHVKEGDTYSFGDHTVTFVGAPMVHWPEAMVTFDTTNGVLFSGPPVPHQHRGQVWPPHPAAAGQGRRHPGPDPVYLPPSWSRVAEGSGLLHRQVRQMEPL